MGIGPLRCRIARKQQQPSNEELLASIKRITEHVIDTMRKGWELGELNGTHCTSNMTELGRAITMEQRRNIDVSESSREYLARQDVHEQAVDRLQQAKLVLPIEMQPSIKLMLGCAYLEITVTDGNKKQVELNFWPCSDCACVAWKVL